MIRILLADDEHLIRSALAALLAFEDGIDVVAEAPTGTEAVAMALRHKPDIAVLDMNMPGKDGLAVARELSHDLPACKVVIVTSHALPGHLKRALAQGVRGYAAKTVSARQFATIIRSVHAGERYIDPAVAADAIGLEESPLSAREARVLSLASDGAPIEEIAVRAGLAPGTIRNYLSSVTTKLQVENRHLAARIAQRRGWISPTIGA